MPDAPPLTINIIDETPEHNVVEVLAQNLAFGETTEYLGLPLGEHLVEVVNAADNTQIDVYRFDLSVNQTFILLTSGLLEDGSFTLIGFDALGNPIPSAIKTSVDAVEATPSTFTLHGNYPNPFNPTTTLRFDLPETAWITVEVIDLLGRTVLTTPAQQREAGSNRTVALDASGLASGTYLYRVRAQTAQNTQLRTGRMTVIK